jgi:hypothetical protein
MRLNDKAAKRGLLKEAPSRGRYYNQNIRAGRFDCRDHQIPQF